MPETSTLVGFAIFCAIVGLGLYFMFGRGGASVAFRNDREKQLTNELADRVGCPLGYALEFVRRELSISPDEDDQTILKRAEYHCRRDLPENAPCRTYRDSTRG